jgi:hypothetical protein
LEGNGGHSTYFVKISNNQGHMTASATIDAIWEEAVAVAHSETSRRTDCCGEFVQAAHQANGADLIRRHSGRKLRRNTVRAAASQVFITHQFAGIALTT